MSFIVAIDGPAGSGKGTIAKKIAEKYGLINIDSGAMYRCVALYALRNGIENNSLKIIESLKEIKIRFDDAGRTYLNNEDVTDAIRSREVTDIVSPISTILPVREDMTNQQREMAKGVNVVMEGRDITTVIFPNAEYKFYLDASVDERTRRRVKQNAEKGIFSDYDEIKKSIEERDYNDMHKRVGALKRTDEQIYIDSTNMQKEEVVDFIIKRVGEVK